MNGVQSEPSADSLFFRITGREKDKIGYSEHCLFAIKSITSFVYSPLKERLACKKMRSVPIY